RIPSRASQGECEDRAGRDRGSGERGEIEARRGDSEQHRSKRAGRRPSGDAQNGGIGERVFEENWKQRACQREELAAGDPGERPGRAHAPDDFARDLVAAPEERVGELPWAEIDAAERDREREARGNERDDENRDDLHSRLMICQPRALASRRRISSGSTATGCVTRSSSGRSLCESL